MCGCVISVDLLINIFSILICLLFWFGFWSFSDDRPNFGKKSKLENRFFIDRTITSDSLTNTHERDHKLFFKCLFWNIYFEWSARNRFLLSLKTGYMAREMATFKLSPKSAKFSNFENDVWTVWSLIRDQKFGLHWNL